MAELVPVEHDPFNPNALAAGATAISASDPLITGMQQGADIQQQRFSGWPQQQTTQYGDPYYQAGASYPEPAPTQPAAPAYPSAIGPETPLTAYEYAPELSDPRVRDRLMAYTQAEVGSQGPQAQQSFIEATIRRAKLEGKTIEQVLATQYFPGVTHRRATGGVSDAERALYDPMIDQALSGSNVSNWATGNASGSVGFAGGPRTASYGGENYGVEGWTLPAIRAAMEGGELKPVGDLNERAAARTRISVRPEGGRREGAATRFAENLLSPETILRNQLAWPQFGVNLGRGLAQSAYTLPGRLGVFSQEIAEGNPEANAAPVPELWQYLYGANAPFMQRGALGAVGGLPHGEARPLTGQSPAGGGGVQPARGGAGGSGGLEAAQRAAAEAAGPRQPLAGLPTQPLPLPDGSYVPGPNHLIHTVAEGYMRSAGLPYNPPRTYSPVDAPRARSIAQAFEHMEHNPNDPAVKASYDALINESVAQFQALQKTGLKIEFIKPGMKDPYEASPRLANKDMRDNNHLWVFPTEGGFGEFGEAGIIKASEAQHPMLQPTGIVVDGRNMLANDVFRIVHDYFGHFKDGNGFRAAGEENAWRSHSAMYSDLARGAMTSETRGQNSWTNFGPHGEKNRTAKAADTVFSEQKAGLLPDWAIEEGRLDPQGPGKTGASVVSEPTAPQPRPPGTVKLNEIEHDPFALEQYPGMISSRFPTAKKATEDPLKYRLSIDEAAMRADPEAYKYNTYLVRRYPNLTKEEAKGPPEQVARNFIEHVKSNLTWLYNRVPPEIRERSKLWYDGANSIVKNRAEATGADPASVAGVYAAMSPQKDWFQNVSLGDRVLDTFHNQADKRFSPQMAAKAQEIMAKTGKEIFDADTLRRIRGKTFNELYGINDPSDRAFAQAAWVRLFDEAHRSPDYHLVMPEGAMGELVRNADGKPAKMGWGSLTEIAKAIQSLDDKGNVNAISARMGERHKVRSFYNNMLHPNATTGDVTIDTHAVAAGLMRPLSGNSVEVSHNFGNYAGKGVPGTRNSSITGASGLYGLYADAYREAARDLGLLPRELQSVTWEAVRGLFTDTFKSQKKNTAAIDKMWRDYRAGKFSHDEVREKIHDYAGGINPPDWFK